MTEPVQPVEAVAHRIDEISMMMGRMDAYIHEHRHVATNTSAKIDALDHVVSRKLENMETRITGSIDKLRIESAAEAARIDGKLSARIEQIETGQLAKLAARTEKLEADKLTRDGASGLLAAVLKSPALGWAIAAIGGAAAWLSAHPSPVVHAQVPRIERSVGQ